VHVRLAERGRSVPAGSARGTYGWNALLRREGKAALYTQFVVAGWVNWENL
jgi:hypothetical protein